MLLFEILFILIISKARELLLNGDIDGADYKTIKAENEYKINGVHPYFALKAVAK
jgi:hypothetical protein